MAVSVFNFFFKSFYRATGPVMPDGLDLQQLAQQSFSSASGITANATGTQATATPLTATYNEIDTAAANAGVLLPPAIPGVAVMINNAGANSIQVFGQASNAQNNNAGDTVAAHNSTIQTATATGVAQASGYVAWYYCTTLGQWKQDLSA